VDAEGRVRGVGGLRVVDASIFPVVPCANTNFPVLMAAEKIADAALAEAEPAIAAGGRAMA
jgi:5-(hydroxymethyl)furfural/furfural oxidase